jgi:hypothetical protein
MIFNELNFYLLFERENDMRDKKMRKNVIILICSVNFFFIPNH